MNKVLILGSGHSINQYNEQHYIDWTIVAVNNAWQKSDHWQYLVHSTDFEGKKPDAQPGKTVLSNYAECLHKYGGHHQCGFSIVPCAAYWVLHTLKPELIGFLGCDLDYTQDQNGHTHFYGEGLDFKKHGHSDLYRFLDHHKTDQYNHSIELLYSRFQYYANIDKCLVFNLSDNPKSRLPFRQATRQQAIDLLTLYKDRKV